LKIDDLIEAFRSSRYRITDHAVEEAYSDDLNFNHILESIYNGEVIEDYPDDRPFPSCLVLGYYENNKPVHCVIGFNNENMWAVIITVYRPDPERWIDNKVRRRQ
jgi:hypothetical protein